MRTALFPGSFDPFHNGHLEIVETASRLFERIVIAPGPNRQKAPAVFSYRGAPGDDRGLGRLIWAMSK